MKIMTQCIRVESASSIRQKTMQILEFKIIEQVSSASLASPARTPLRVLSIDLTQKCPHLVERPGGVFHLLGASASMPRVGCVSRNKQRVLMRVQLVVFMCLHAFKGVQKIMN